MYFLTIGDGGLAMGSALLANYELNGVHKYDFSNVYFGPQYCNDYIKSLLEKDWKAKASWTYVENIEKETARLLSQNNIVLWFQGEWNSGRGHWAAGAYLPRHIPRK